jgi:hypothetical protein
MLRIGIYISGNKSRGPWLLDRLLSSSGFAGLSPADGKAQKRVEGERCPSCHSFPWPNGRIGGNCCLLFDCVVRCIGHAGGAGVVLSHHEPVGKEEGMIRCVYQ